LAHQPLQIVGDRAEPGHDTGVGPHVSSQRETALTSIVLHAPPQPPVGHPMAKPHDPDIWQIGLSAKPLFPGRVQNTHSPPVNRPPCSGTLLSTPSGRNNQASSFAKPGNVGGGTPPATSVRPSGVGALARSRPRPPTCTGWRTSAPTSWATPARPIRRL
jgi:hypothetical protein